ncbi:MAG: ribonuclease J [Clostridiales bacterium]|nr:ribonuclease J [Clostridiales bacterium]
MQNNRRTSSRQPAKKAAKAERKPKSVASPALPVRIAFLGGLNEVGKNMTLYEYGDDMFIVDCGLAFPDTEMLGVDLVIPDFTYVERNRKKIRGIVITHGHEDHIGGLVYLLKTVNIPVYATRLTAGLIEGKLAEHGILNDVRINCIEAGDTIKLGQFEVEAIHVNHSIPDSVGLAIKSPAGVIIQTGDFKIDSTPIDGEIIDLARFSELGKQGVLCLLSDSTNAVRPGYTESEKKVGETFSDLFAKARGRRIIIATFASNIHRVQQIMNIAKDMGRKVALSGRSLEYVVEKAADLGYLNVPDNLLVSIDSVNNYPADKMVIITTGSQGEPMSALHRMAFSEHRRVSIIPNDYVIISATPIPGNEKTVGRVVDELLKLGAEVIYEKMYDVHVSGHACQEELKLMLGITKPKYFIPVHGEQKHLRRHSALAQSMGIPRSNIIIADNGKQVEITDNKISVVNEVPAGKVFVDGYGVGDVGSIVIRDRKRLSADGIIVVAVTLSQGLIVNGPEVITRGFVYVRENEELIETISSSCEKVINDCLYDGITDHNSIKNRIRDEASRLVYERTKRNPMILPIIMEV